MEKFDFAKPSVGLVSLIFEDINRGKNPFRYENIMFSVLISFTQY